MVKFGTENTTLCPIFVIKFHFNEICHIAGRKTTNPHLKNAIPAVSHAFNPAGNQLATALATLNHCLWQTI